MVGVTFIHPDLGIGGAERLVVDAALSLKRKGHSVLIYTAHHDRDHCFEETRNGMLTVIETGDWLPRSLLGRCFALCAYIRMIYVALYILMCGNTPEVIFCDQLSVCIPFLRLTRAKIIFYCHFPDLLLTDREGFLKKVYRFPLDYFEELTTGMADLVLVNSNFTARTFASTFSRLPNITPGILYPSLSISGCEETPELFPEQSNIDMFGIPDLDNGCVFLSINRFERKKNISLAVQAFRHLRETLDVDKWRLCHLVIAGGFDERVKENIEYYGELTMLADKLNLKNKITFVRSFSGSDKLHLLHRCVCLLYTPAGEHFGIVPLEAMYMRRPVIAHSSGGPLETVVDRVTGYLRDNDPVVWGNTMAEFVLNPELCTEMGVSGRIRVDEKFSSTAFSENLNMHILSLLARKSK